LAIRQLAVQTDLMRPPPQIFIYVFYFRTELGKAAAAKAKKS